MEFKSSYLYTMESRCLSSRTHIDFATVLPPSEGFCVYSHMVSIDLCDSDTLEIPVSCINEFDRFNRNHGKNSLEGIKLVVPLVQNNCTTGCSGAETILKKFSREYHRLLKCTTPKGEVYYGGTGIVLDKDFTPLLLTTVSLSKRENEEVEYSYYKYDMNHINVYINPKVYTDDSRSLNKALAKKGTAYFLSYNLSNGYYRGGTCCWPSSGNLKYNVKIEDVSRFIVKVDKPDVNHCSAKDFSDFLKGNIADVLEQVKYDYR